MTDDSGLTIILVVLTLVFVLLSALIAWRRHRLADIRTLRLGRLTLLFWFGILIVLNLGILTAVSISSDSWLFALVLLGIELVIVLFGPMILGLLIPISVLVLTIKMWRRESKSLANLLLPAVYLAFLIIDIVYGMIGKLPQSWSWLKVLSATYPVLSVYMGWQFAVFYVSSRAYGRRVKKLTAHYFVVHGAGLIDGERVSTLLGNRVKAAVEAAKNDDTVILIMSGGKGDDEHLTEAAAMRDYAVNELHFPEERILLEDKSTTTYENLVNTSQMIHEPFMFFTSDFHVFRTALFAASLHLQAEGGAGGKTALYYRVPAFIREFIAVMNSQRKKHIIWISVIVVIWVLLALAQAFFW